MESKTSQIFPGILQWKIGDKRITVLNDGHFQIGSEYLTHVDGDAASILGAALRPEIPTLITNVYVIESENHAPVLIDTGVGDKLAPAIKGNFRESLQHIGLTPEDIGYVLLTHLHGDHFYGLIDKEGTKNFPNAKVWVSDAERKFWLENENLNDQDRQNGQDAKEYLAPYDVLGTKGEILPGISEVPLPGHTPGQTGFLLETGDEKVLFCADVLGIPAVQAKYPEVGFATDVDYELGVATRRGLLKKAADEKLLLAGAHFEFPCITYVKNENDHYTLISKQWFGQS
ncbi:MBL fold metallo-hydrolase [Flavobacterium sp. RHBU_24]|uniref:MBL fold metallo-hydrolase n=1 Tax=Flavobacterium sp. RHBU_24 TaxID=3391185 RepID=UPI0039849135